MTSNLLRFLQWTAVAAWAAGCASAPPTIDVERPTDPENVMTKSAEHDYPALQATAVHRPVEGFNGGFKVGPGSTQLVLNHRVDGYTGYFSFWDYASGDVSTPAEIPHYYTFIDPPTPSPGGDVVVSTNQQLANILDAKTADWIRSFKVNDTIDAMMGSTVFTPDGRRLISSFSGARAAVWDLESPEDDPLIGDYFLGHLVPQPIDGGDWPRGGLALAVSPDGRLALTGDAAGRAVLWDIDSREIWWKIPPPLPQEQRHRYLSTQATGRDNGPRHGKHNPSPPPPRFRPEPVGTLAFFPDGTKFVVGTTFHRSLYKNFPRMYMVRIFDTHQGWEVARLRESVHGVAVSPDGNWVVLAGVDSGLLWDWRHDRVWALHGHLAITEDYDDYQSLKDPPEPGAIWSVAFTPDGRQAITGGADGTIRFWEVPQD